jgi:hypothetical protein
MADLKMQYELIATNYNEEITGQAYYEKLVNPTVRKMLGDVKGKVKKRTKRNAKKLLQKIFKMNIYKKRV